MGRGSENENGSENGSESESNLVVIRTNLRESLSGSNDSRDQLINLLLANDGTLLNDISNNDLYQENQFWAHLRNYCLTGSLDSLEQVIIWHEKHVQTNDEYRVSPLSGALSQLLGSARSNIAPETHQPLNFFNQPSCVLLLGSLRHDYELNNQKKPMTETQKSIYVVAANDAYLNLKNYDTPTFNENLPKARSEERLTTIINETDKRKSTSSIATAVKAGLCATAFYLGVLAAIAFVAVTHGLGSPLVTAAFRLIGKRAMTPAAKFGMSRRGQKAALAGGSALLIGGSLWGGKRILKKEKEALRQKPSTQALTESQKAVLKETVQWYKPSKRH